MTTTTVVIVVVVVVIVLALLVAGGLALARRRRTQQLRRQFGPEYDRVLSETGSRAETEKALRERRDRHDEFDIRSLDASTRERFHGEWQQVQRSFVDDPGGSVDRADGLVTEVMRARGYPVDDFDQRAADLSVNHPQVVENYRAARQVRDAHRSGEVGTEDLRAAVTSYRDLVDSLLDEGDGHGGDDDGRSGRHSGTGISGRRDDRTDGDTDEPATQDGRRDGSRR